jgi:hypothetical protein
MFSCSLGAFPFLRGNLASRRASGSLALGHPEASEPLALRIQA